MRGMSARKSVSQASTQSSVPLAEAPTATLKLSCHACSLQKGAHGDAGGGVGGGYPEPGDVALHRSIQLYLTVFDELHDRKGRERLARRADLEGSPRCNISPGIVGLPEALEVDDLVSLDDA